MKIGIVVGEASGDILGMGLINALRERYPDLECTGIAGPKMLAAGCQTLYPMERLSIMGFIEPLRRLPELIKMRRGLYQHFIANPPDIFIGIDAPDFNIGLELKLKATGIRTLHYVSPSVWAWRKNRIHKIAKAVDCMLTLFPFEAAFYREHQVPVKCIGHPLADAIPLEIDQQAARQKLGLDPSAPYIALLPGSRHQEIQRMGELFIRTAQWCLQKNPALRFVVPMINPERKQQFLAICQQLNINLPLTITDGHSADVLAAVDAVLVKAGTATLEAMLYKRPMVIVYRTSAFNFFIAKLLVKIKYIGLPNLIADQALVPEFIQAAAQPELLGAALLDFFNNPAKTKTLQARFTQLHNELRKNASRQAAAAVIEVIQGK